MRNVVITNAVKRINRLYKISFENQISNIQMEMEMEMEMGNN